MKVLHIVTVLHYRLVGVLVGLVLGCSGQESPYSNQSSGSDPARSAAFETVGTDTQPAHVDYYLHWNTDDINTVSNGWQVRSDSGYLVTIEAGWLSNYRISLAVCVGNSWWKGLGIRVPYK